MLQRGQLLAALVSRLKARGEISLKMANGGELKSSCQRWRGDMTDVADQQ